MSVLDYVASDAGEMPSWVVAPPADSMQTQALVEMTNPATGEVWTAPSGGYSINPDVTTQIPQETTIPGYAPPVQAEAPVAQTVEGNRFAFQYPDQAQQVVDPTVLAAIDILNLAPSVGPAQIALDADREYLEGTGASGLYTVLPTSTGDSTTAVYGADWRDRLVGTEDQPSGTTTTVVDEAGGGDSWDDITYSDFTGDLTTGFTDAISTLGDSIMDSITGLGLGDLATDISESITGTLSDFGLDAVSDTLSDLGVSIGDMATDISESITGTLSDFGLDAVSDTLSDLGVSIGDIATDLGEGFIQIGDSIVDTVTGAVTDLSGELVGVVDDIGENISGAVTDIGTNIGSAVETIGEGVESAISPVTEALAPIGEAVTDIVDDVTGAVGEVVTGLLPDQPDEPEGVGPQFQGEYGAILSVIDNMVDGMTFAEAMDALYSDPETGLSPGEIGSPYGWDWGSVLDPAYGALSFTTPYDVVDSEGSPATNDPGGTVTDSAGNPVGVETGGTLGYGDLTSAADAYGTDPGSDQTQMLTEQDAGLTDYSDLGLDTAEAYGTTPGSEQTEMLAEQDNWADVGVDTGSDDSGWSDDSGYSGDTDGGWGGGDVAGGDTGAGDTADDGGVGGGDGGGDCFIASTMIDMADGSKKRIDEVAVGEFVLSADGKSSNEIKYIEEIDWKDDYHLYSPDKGNKPFITQNHPVMIDGQWFSADIDYTERNHPWIDAKPLKDGVHSHGNGVTVYNLWVDGDHTFKVNGYGTSSLIGDGGVVRMGLEHGIIDWDDFVSIVNGAKDAGHVVNYGMHLGNRIMAKFSSSKRYTKWMLDSVMGNRKGYTIKALIYLFGVAGVMSKPRLWFKYDNSEMSETIDQGAKA